MSKSSKATEDQHARFVETARKLETNDDPAAFEALFGKLVPPVLPGPEKKDSEPRE